MTEGNRIRVITTSKVEMKITIELSEVEARALEAIAGYGPSKFKEWFYKNLGKHYLEPHSIGVDSLFATVKKELPYHLNKIDEVRKLLKDKL